MNVYELFPSKYVKAHDLNGRDVTVTIRSLVVEEVGAPPNTDEKPVVYFKKTTKGLILNKTNATQIAALYGPETENWAEKRITLYPTQVRAFGSMHQVIRIRDQVPPEKKNNGDNGADLEDAEDVVDPEDVT